MAAGARVSIIGENETRVFCKALWVRLENRERGDVGSGIVKKAEMRKD